MLLYLFNLLKFIRMCRIFDICFEQFGNTIACYFGYSSVV